MRMRNLVFFVVILLLLLPISIFAKEIELTFWHSLGFHVKQLVEDMVEEYNRSTPGVKVNPVFQGLYEEMQVKMMASAVTRQLPDVAQVQFEYMDAYIDNGIVAPIDDWVTLDLREDIPENFWELVSKNGHIYGIPFAVSTMVFFYNENAFREAGLDPDKPPETWDDVIRLGKILTRDTDGDGQIDTYAMMFWAEGMYGIAPFLWEMGGRFADESGKILLTSPEMVKTISFLKDLVYKYRIMPQNWTDWEGGQAFLRGKLAMGPFTSAAISYGEQNLPWKLRIVKMPSMNGIRATALSGSSLMTFSRKKKRMRASIDFMHFMVSKKNTIRLHKDVGYVPVRLSAIKSLEIRAFHKEKPNFKVAVESLDFAKPLPRNTEYFKINEIIRDMLQKVILQNSDPEIELKKAQERVDELFE
ncbi:MAG: hypothetical protein DRP54_05955 [Spirochaetes bacterium]|nr:MAG: hypothetical protein DRP54_05955 [Spirochaetota bacterium]